MLTAVFFISTDMNQTASYFGDKVLTLRQIYKVVDEVFDTVSVVSQDEDEEISFDECVARVKANPLIQDMLKKRLKQSHRVTFAPVHQVRKEDGSEYSLDISIASPPLTPLATIPVGSKDDL